MSNLEILALNNYGNSSPLPELESGTKPTVFPISFPTTINIPTYYYTQTTHNPISQAHPQLSLSASLLILSYLSSWNALPSPSCFVSHLLFFTIFSLSLFSYSLSPQFQNKV